MQDKRGLSAIIGTLLIILLVIVAVGIIWVVVRGVLEESSDDISFSTLTTSAQIQSASIEGDSAFVTVKRDEGEGNMLGVKISVSDCQESVVQEFRAAEGGDLESLEIGTFEVVGISALGEIAEITIAPILELESGEEALGSVTDTYTIGEGSPGGGGGPPGCTPDLNACLNLDCGTVTNGTCGDVSCGTCDPLTEDCVNNICVPNNCVNETFAETCTDKGLTCGEWPNNCGYLIDCGSCAWPDVCNETGQCETLLLLSGGDVDSVWPGSAPTYFDSPSLPKDNTTIQEFRLKYVNFSSASSLCVQVATAEHATGPGYNMSHIGFDYVVSYMGPGDTFDIWETFEACSGA